MFSNFMATILGQMLQQDGEQLKTIVFFILLGSCSNFRTVMSCQSNPEYPVDQSISKDQQD